MTKKTRKKVKNPPIDEDALESWKKMKQQIAPFLRKRGKIIMPPVDVWEETITRFVYFGDRFWR